MIARHNHRIRCRCAISRCPLNKPRWLAAVSAHSVVFRRASLKCIRPRPAYCARRNDIVLTAAARRPRVECLASHRLRPENTPPACAIVRRQIAARHTWRVGADWVIAEHAFVIFAFLVLIAIRGALARRTRKCTIRARTALGCTGGSVLGRHVWRKRGFPRVTLHASCRH